MNAGDKIAFVRRGTEDFYILFGKAGVAQAPRHGLRRGGDVAGGRISGVDLDEFLEDVTG